MIIELFIFFEIVTVGLFVLSFYERKELLWALTLVLSAIMAINSFFVEKTYYIFNGSTAYVPTVISNSYPYIATINILFFSLSMLFMLYGIFANRLEKKQEEGF